MPLYWQLVERLTSAIETGELTGEIPAEADLAAAWNVSRDTVRRAFDRLGADGLLRRSRGRNTEVVAPVGSRQWLRGRDLSTYLTFAAETRVTVTIRYGPATADVEIAEELHATAAAPAFGLERVSYAASGALALERVWFPPGVASRFVLGREPSNAEIFRAIVSVAGEAGFGPVDLVVDETLEAVLLDGEIAEMLQIEEKTPGFHTERRILAGSVAGELRRTYVAADRGVFHIVS